MESSTWPSTQGNSNITNSQTQTSVSSRLNDPHVKESSSSKISGISSKDKSLQQQRKMHYRPKQKPADNGQRNEQTQVQQPISQSIQQPTLQTQKQPVIQQYTNNIRHHPFQQQTNTSQQHPIFQSSQQQQTPYQQHAQPSATQPTQYLPVFVENLPLDTDAEDFKMAILSHLNIDPSKMYISHF